MARPAIFFADGQAGQPAIFFADGQAGQPAIYFADGQAGQPALRLAGLPGLSGKNTIVRGVLVARPEPIHWYGASGPRGRMPTTMEA
jgi:hypothetical protein